jgi:polar amino acid transport system substrate-binding protein
MVMNISRRGLAGFAASATAAGFLIPSAEADTLDETLKNNVLRVGINPNSPPFSARNASGDFAGFDVAIGNLLAKELKIDKVNFVPTNTDQRVPFLVANTIDISLGGLTRNSERAKLIEYTAPLHSEVMGVLTTDKVKISSYQELNDPKYTLVDVRSSWTVDWAKENLPKAKLEVVDNNADVVRAVAQGRGDAIVEMLDFFMAFTKDHTDVNWQVLGSKIDVGWDAIGVQKGNYALRDCLNIALFKLHSNGTVVDEWKKAFGSEPLEKVPYQPYF